MGWALIVEPLTSDGLYLAQPLSAFYVVLCQGFELYVDLCLELSKSIRSKYYSSQVSMEPFLHIRHVQKEKETAIDVQRWFLTKK